MSVFGIADGVINRPMPKFGSLKCDQVCHLRPIVCFLCITVFLSNAVWVRAGGTSDQTNYDAEIKKAISAPDNSVALDVISRMLDDAKGYRRQRQ